MRNPLRRRYQVVTTSQQSVATRWGVTVLIPTFTHRGAKFWFRSSAVRYARWFDLATWNHYGSLTESTVEVLS